MMKRLSVTLVIIIITGLVILAAPEVTLAAYQVIELDSVGTGDFHSLSIDAGQMVWVKRDTSTTPITYTLKLYNYDGAGGTQELDSTSTGDFSSVQLDAGQVAWVKTDTSTTPVTYTLRLYNYDRAGGTQELDSTSTGDFSSVQLDAGQVAWVKTDTSTTPVTYTLRLYNYDGAGGTQELDSTSTGDLSSVQLDAGQVAWVKTDTSTTPSTYTLKLYNYDGAGGTHDLDYDTGYIVGFSLDAGQVTWVKSDTSTTPVTYTLRLYNYDGAGGTQDFDYEAIGGIGETSLDAGQWAVVWYYSGKCWLWLYNYDGAGGAIALDFEATGILYGISLDAGQLVWVKMDTHSSEPHAMLWIYNYDGAGGIKELDSIQPGEIRYLRLNAGQVAWVKLDYSTTPHTCTLMLYKHDGASGTQELDSTSTGILSSVQLDAGHVVWIRSDGSSSKIFLSNELPQQPSNVSPGPSAITTLTPMLSSSPFSDPEGDRHSASQWQITNVSGDYSGSHIVYDSGTSISHLTTISIPSGKLSYATTYYWRVRYQDNHAGWSEWSTETSFTTMAAPVDSTPPTTPMVTDDGASTSNTTQLHATWTASDPESGIAEYQYAIGTSSEATDVVGWTSAGTNTEVTEAGLSLTWGTSYYFAVKARNGQGLWSEIGVSNGVTVSDTTPPTTPMVTDDGASTSNTTQLHATWTASDPESGIAEYQYAIGTSSGATDVVGWTSAGTNTELTKTGLSLTLNTTYRVAVKAKNGAGTWSEVGVSDGITVKRAGPLEVDFSANTTEPIEGQAITFTSLCSGGAAPFSYEWDFNNDGTIDSTARQPTYAYSTIGTYTVSLKVTDALGSYVMKIKAGYITIVIVVTQQDIPTEGGTVQTTNGQISTTFLADTVTTTATVTIKEISAASIVVAPRGFKVGNTCFTIEARDASGNAIITLSELITITVKYSDGDVAAAGGDPNKLALAYYDEATGEWKTLDTTVNIAEKTVSATTSHLSQWAILARVPDPGFPLWAWIVVGIAVAVVIIGAGQFVLRRGKRKAQAIS